MVHPIFQLTEWLERQKDRNLVIYKEELATGKQEVIDQDRVQMLLENITARTIEHHDEDDYLADQEIILHGVGHIYSDEGIMELPQQVYEIPLLGEITTHNEKNIVKVETEKAIYTIFSE
ncbi:hypothetical protein QA612_01200 [Evansella sp. AB-P1]|uniref:hypothetical protein n=1 Tax=Evansella sp. AB-P1 TaxID=3037653 RepID=UPI00241F1825|nr:hypothetical protein [Evansella sp. AB-P1]MDG5786088.1 hypothetical protein [Evansella sp. AB-P1]